MKACIFCKIAQKEIPAHMHYEDEKILAFNDVQSQAPLHILVIPRKHIATVNDLTTEDLPLIGLMTDTAKNLAKEYAVSEKGYRLVMNCHHDGGQSVFHLHLHLLAGRAMSWPPG